MKMIAPHILDAFAAITGPEGCLRDDAAMAPYMREERGRVTGRSPCVLLPQNTAQVAKIVGLCALHRIPLVPQGGKTGLAGAGVSTPDGDMLTLNLSRMNAIHAVDSANFSMRAEAGCTLANARKAAEEKNRFLAMSFAAEGAASVGGAIATNAGGSFTPLYGPMRAQILGIEAVMADGSVFRDLRGLRKNNSGYDMRNLLCGSEGTLGIITAASLALRPLPAVIETALAGFAGIGKAVEALGALREKSGDGLAAFEIMPRLAVESAVHYGNQREPFAQHFPWTALIELHGADGQARLETALDSLVKENMAADAALAKNVAEAKAFWQLREAVIRAQKNLGASLKHDVALPLNEMADFLARAAELVEKTIPGARPYVFGHLGDGSLHYNISMPEDGSPAAFLARRDEMAVALHDLVLGHGGSINAEHGIGRFKREEFLRTTPPANIALMRRIKAALDPGNILNPGAVV